MAFYSPLRYPGGKGKLANYFKLILQYNDLLDVHYVEPYAGGAGIALSLLFNHFVSHIHINDLNRSVYAFWYATLYETTALCDRILETEVTMDEWHRQQEVQQTPHASLLDLGFSTFFLNRTNRSGIITGGVIGGQEQESIYKLDARYNKEELLNRIRHISRYRNRITIYNIDAKDFISVTLPTLPQRAIVYLDPPYYVKGQGLYENYYEPQDHAEIAALVAHVPQYWIVSYDNVPEVIRLYQSARSITYQLSYSAADRYKGTEIMFFCDRLEFPLIPNPAKVTTATVNKLFMQSLISYA